MAEETKLSKELANYNKKINADIDEIKQTIRV